MNKKVIIYFSGGIGNQIFQYCAGRYFANKCNGKLLFESNFGFLIDRKFRRKFIIDRAFNLSYTPTNFVNTLIFVCYLFKRKFLSFFGISTNSFLKNFFIVEDDLNNINFNYLHENYATYWVIGYWQKQLEFVEHSEFLDKHLKLLKPQDISVLDLGDEMCRVESVALGIRFYEEVRDPKLFMGSTIESQTIRLNKAIKDIKNEYPNAIFYIFSSHSSNLINSLILPKDTKLITGDMGFEDPIYSLWLISQCKHQIFTASSFYWWGAWLSMKNYKNHIYKQKIITISNNNYLSVKLPHWEVY